MKKATFLFFLMALAFSAKAVVFPADWPIQSTPWSSYQTAPVDFARKTSMAVYFGAYYDFENLQGNVFEFEDAWDRIPFEYELSNLVAQGLDYVPSKPNDFVSASFKVGYDDVGFFVFVVYEDDEESTLHEQLEILYSPYHRLEEGGRNFTVNSEDRSGILCTRYWDLGASKIATTPTAVRGIMKLSLMGAVGDMTPDDVWSNYGLVFEFANCTNILFEPNKYRWAVKIPYKALNDTYYGTVFDKEAWKEACDGKGISFDVKFSDNDSDLLPGSWWRTYWWSADVNDGFWSTDWAGFLKPLEPLPPSSHFVTVTGGTSDKPFAETSETVTITAAPPMGKRFDGWSVKNNEVVLNDPNAAVTTFSMPGKNVTIAANFVEAEYTLTVVGGTAMINPEGENPDRITEGKAKYDDVIMLFHDATAEPSGKKFSGWLRSDGGSKMQPANLFYTIFTMPACDLTVTADFTTAYTITVIDGLIIGDASGKALVGENLLIVANLLSKEFINWTSDGGGVFAQPSERNTTFTMPDNDVTVTAHYAQEKTKHTLTMVGGLADGKETLSLTEGNQASLIATENKIFLNWESDGGGVFAQPSERNTTFTMPDNDATVTARYEGIAIEGAETGNIRLHPNPADNYIQIADAEGGNVYIFNAAGQQVLSVSNYSGRTIDVSVLAPGVYTAAYGKQAISFIKK